MVVSRCAPLEALVGWSVDAHHGEIVRAPLLIEAVRQLDRRPSGPCAATVTALLTCRSPWFIATATEATPKWPQIAG
jgi:hypothetical protein